MLFIFIVWRAASEATWQRGGVAGVRSGVAYDRQFLNCATPHASITPQLWDVCRRRPNNPDSIVRQNGKHLGCGHW